MNKILISVLLFFSNEIYAQQPKLMLPVGHTGFIVSGQFSSDGNRIVTASWDNTAKIWDAKSGILLADLRANTPVLSAQFSPDGKKIVTGCYDNTAKIWDATTGILLLELKGHVRKVNYAQFSPDGNKIVTASDDPSAKIWDAISGKFLFELKHTNNVQLAQFSMDGKKILTVSYEFGAQILRDTTKIKDANPKIWDAETGVLLADLKSSKANITTAEFSPDGKKVVTTSRDTTADIWDAGTGEILKNLKGHTKAVVSAEFSPDGKKIITASYDSTAKIWDLSTGELLANLKENSNAIIMAKFSYDQKKIIIVNPNYSFKIYDYNTGQSLHDIKEEPGNFGWMDFANLSCDRKKIAIPGKHNSINIWDIDSGILLTNLKEHSYPVTAAQFSPDGNRIVMSYGDNTGKIIDASSGKCLVSLKDNISYTQSVSYSSDGSMIVTASADSTAKIWDAVSGKLLIALRGHKKNVTCAQFSPDGKRIVTGSSDSTTKIWDVKTGEFIKELKGKTYQVLAVQFTPDGKKIVIGASDDDEAKIWDPENGSFLTYLKGHSNYVTSIQFSPDGKKVVTGSYDRTTKVWDVATQKLLFDLQGGGIPKFNRDGTKIIAGFKIWDTKSGKQLFNLYEDQAVYDSSEVYDQNSEKVITPTTENSAKIWDAQTGKLLYTYLPLDSSDYLILDKYNHYDGTEAARKLLYFTCGTEVIELDQVKDQLWVPNLAERIMKGETINAKTINDLNICGLTPKTETIDGDINEYHFKITPGRGGLGETVLFVNAIEAIRYKQAQLKKMGTAFELIVKKDELKNYFIPGKENTVSVKAYTSDNNISSRGIIIKEDQTKQSAATPNLYAVMVGVSDYKGEEMDLKYAAKDATDLSGAIANAARKLLNNTDGKEHVFMYNLTTGSKRYQLPEKNSIKKILEDIGKKAMANDILLLFFAGHGVMETGKKQFYFLTADASYISATDAIADVGISTNELAEWMKPQNIKAQKRILIFDACNSGQAINDFIKMGTGDQNYVVARNDDKAQQIKAIDKLNERSGLFILCASASNQSAYEMGRYSQGLLTYSLLRAIKQQPDILEDGKFLNLGRWFNAAENTVSEISRQNNARQEPQIVTNTNFNIGIVDNEVTRKIILPQEKPLFVPSNFQNSDEHIADDNLDLSSAINKQLYLMASGKQNPFDYTENARIPDSYLLRGGYVVTGDNLSVKVNVKKDKEILFQFEVTGKKDSLNLLAQNIVQQVVKYIQGITK